MGMPGLASATQSAQASTPRSEGEIPAIFNPRRGRTPSVLVTSDGHGPSLHHADSITTNNSAQEVSLTPTTLHPPGGLQRTMSGVKNSCCSRPARKIFCGVIVTVLVTTSWVGATHWIKYLFLDSSKHRGQTFSNSSIHSTHIATFNAPFFTTWFITNWTVLFFPIYFILSLMVPNRNSAGKIVSESIRNFREKGYTVGRFFMRCALFCLLWVATNYMYVYSLKSLLATDVMTLFATNVASVYLLSWVILHEQFVGVRIVAVILCDTGVALFAYMDGITGSPTLGGVVLAVCAAAGSAVYKVLFKKFIGEASYGQVSFFFSLIGLFNASLLWPVCLTLYFTGVETWSWERMPWMALLNASGLSLAANLLGNFSCAVTYDLFITLGLITAVPVSAALDVVLYGAQFQGMKMSGMILIGVGFCLVMFPDDWPDYITRLLRNIILLGHNARDLCMTAIIAICGVDDPIYLYFNDGVVDTGTSKAHSGVMLSTTGRAIYGLI